MATLHQARLSPEAVTSQAVLDSELPLARLYWNEQERADERLFTQPLHGRVSEWTWASAMREVRQVAAWLRAQNWPAGSRIVILSRNCAWWPMADFAIWMAGHVSVPLFPAASGATIESLVRHCEPVACFLGAIDAVLDFNSESLSHVHCITFPTCTTEPPARAMPWVEIVREQEPLAENPKRGALDVATIIYTSGTTGEPKGAMHTFQALTLMGESIAAAFRNPSVSSNRILSYLPLAHVAERAIVEMNALFSRLELYFVASQDTFLEDLKRARASLFFSVPRLYARFQQKVFERVPEAKLERLLRIPLVGWFVRKRIKAQLGLGNAYIVAGGGAATSPDLIAWYRRLGLNFIEGYGMTETGITHVPVPGHYRLGYVGSSSIQVTTRISAEGEVQIKSPMNMMGYFRNPELTQQVFTTDGYFRTGDRGEIDSEGRLKLIGRLRDEFKTAKGKFVSPVRIERLFASSPSIDSVAVFGAGMIAPIALIVLAPEKRQACESQTVQHELSKELAQLLANVNGELEHHEQLRALVVCNTPWTIENGMLTPTLKLRRQALEHAYAGQFMQWENSGKEIIWLEAK